MDNTLKLKKKLIYTGKLILKTGLHIGGTNAALNIGGPDKFVVRNPINNEPYIPGSSLKGKMRVLIELAYGEHHNGKPSSRVDTKSGALFGTAADKGGHPSRLIVRDAMMANPNDPRLKNTDLLYTESKTEVSIDRITAKANHRIFERVPAGTEFIVNFVLNIFETEDETALRNTLKEAAELLENDYLGGNGSRGYGQVKFEVNWERPEEIHY